MLTLQERQVCLAILALMILAPAAPAQSCGPGWSPQAPIPAFNLCLLSAAQIRLQKTAATPSEAAGKIAIPVSDIREIDAPSAVLLQSSQPAIPDSTKLERSRTAEVDLKQFVAPDVAPIRETYRPLTPAQKLDIFYRSTYSPFTFLSAAFDAGLAQAQGDFRGYGGGMQGYGKRYGAILADSESSIFFRKFLLPWMFKQDPRYFRMEEGPVTKRAFYAVSRLVVTRSDKGTSTFNSSHLLGRLIVKTLTNSYYPAERRGVWPTLRRTSNALITDAGMALAKEFWPDVRDKLLGGQRRRVNRLADRMFIGK